MLVKELELTHNNKTLYTYMYMPKKDIKAIIQIAHGMSEHMGRYKDMANILCSHGIGVVGFDLKGHGKNPGDPSVASFGVDGWKECLEDMNFYYDYISQNYPDVPYFMYGFSLGSFLLREYLNTYNTPIHGAIIVGTGYQPPFILDIIMKIVKTQIHKSGFNNTTPLVQKLSFETYNSKFKNPKTKFDWLCSDTKELELYINDSLCKDAISSGLFYQLLYAMKYTGKSESMNNYNKDLPILLMSGDKDPVGDFSKGVKKVKDIMNDNKIYNVDMKLYANARHDLFHELDSHTAYHAINDLIIWINKNL